MRSKLHLAFAFAFLLLGCGGGDTPQTSTELPMADLNVSLALSVSSAAGRELNLSVSNSGPSAASGVSVIVTLPGGTTMSVILGTTTLANGSTTTGSFTYSVSTTVTQTQVFTATVATTTSDTNTVNNVITAQLPPPAAILFVGNSYTFGRVAPVLQYGTATVSDLTASFNDRSTATNAWPVGSGLPPMPCVNQTTTIGCFEPKPWGGVPAIFKSLTDQSGLNYVVSHSTRNAATLRGHFLNTADPLWDMQANIASKKWDVVVLQGQSDEPLPPTKSKNGNPLQFTKYANLIAEHVHTGAGGTTTEATLYGSLTLCRNDVTATVAGAGGSTTSCNATRTITANVSANAQAKIFLMQTWARPDMVEAHKCTKADQSTLDGSPILDSTCAVATIGGPNGTGGINNVFYTSKTNTMANLADMTTDMHNIFTSLATTTRTSGALRFDGILPVGNAFQQAVNAGVVKGSGFYKPDGTFDDSGTQMNLWWKDSTHASKFGSYLSALVTFGRLTGLNPTRFDGLDRAASDLGISRSQAQTLQGVARDTLVAAGVILR